MEQNEIWVIGTDPPPITLSAQLTGFREPMRLLSVHRGKMVARTR